MRADRLVIAALLAAALAVATGPPASGAAQPRMAVYFVRGEQLAPVMRPGASPRDAVRQLVAGPTRSELRRGFRTYVPPRTPVFGVRVANGIVTVNLGARFAAGDDRAAGLTQLVRTMTALQGVTKVRLLLNGASAAGRYPGIAAGGPLTYRYLQTPNVPVPEPPATKLLPPDEEVKTVQQRLIELGYLLPGDNDGRLGPATYNAVLAFQKWERLRRTGSASAETKARLATANRPVPVSRGSAGRRAEILLDRQVALLIQNNRVVRAIAVSSGKPSTPTPPGDYTVYAKFPRWWSVPFREWLPWALPFVGGIAFHEFLVVPAYPASHGCVRQSYTVARWTYDFASVGMHVTVIARS